MTKNAVAAGSEIICQDLSKRAEDLQVGDQILCFCQNAFVFKPLTHLETFQHNGSCKIYASSHCLKCMASQKLYNLETESWQSADCIKSVAMPLFPSGGRPESLVSCIVDNLEKREKNTEMYQLYLEDAKIFVCQNFLLMT